MKEITRRNLFKLGGVAAVGAASAGMLASCAPASPSASSAGEGGKAAIGKQAGHVREGLPAFFDAPEAVTEIAETKDFDVVIVGAGASGVPAACAAVEAGATVALLQKESTAISQGNTASGILLDKSDPAGVEAVVTRLVKEGQYRSNRDLVEIWAQNSGETIQWLLDVCTAEGAQISDTTAKWTAAIKKVGGYNVDYLSIDFGPKPYNTGEGMKVLADYAAKEGVEVFYSTPAEQLVVGEDGAVTGVIAKGESGYIQFNAAKGVILATGDYQNDDDMMAYYLPDLANFGRKQNNKTGDGHKMAVWAGAAMENITHTKMLHDFDAGPGSMADFAFLATKMDGTRFCDETCGMSLMNNFLRSEADSGNYCQVFDSNYLTQTEGWPGKALPPEAMAAYMPEVEGEKKGVFKDLINTFTADTIEELGEKLGVSDVKAFAKSVERYNELVAKGTDDDFGKEAKWLKPIDTPPFYGIHRQVRVSAVVSGVNVDKNQQVTNAETGEPIPGLFACGNVAGGFYAGVDYSMFMPGLSLGRAHTMGRVLGKYVAEL